MKKQIFTCILMGCLFSTTVLAAGNENKVALVMKALSNPFFIKMEEGARQYAQTNEISLEVFGVERETEIKRQISIVENLIARKYGAIVIAPTDSKKLIPVCKKALDQGIIVVNIDNPFHEATMKKLNIAIPFVGSDNYQGASLVGNYLKKKLGEKGRVLVIEGIRGVENADLRKNGFIDSITKNSHIKIVASESANWHTDEALSRVTKLIQKHAQIDAIFCANDSMAIGAIQSLDMFGLTGDILIGGYDNIEEARSEMRNKRMHATIEQHPEMMGEYGVMLASKGMLHENLPRLTKIPIDLITYDSFDKKVSLSLADGTPFFKQLLDGASQAAALFGLQLETTIANNDDARQLIDIQSFIEKKSDVIIINPTHAESVLPAIELAHAEGIPVMTVDRKLAMTEKVICHIESNNVDGGRMAAEFIAKKLNQKGKILELEGSPGTSAAHDRGKGFNDTIKKYPDLKIIAREVAFFNRDKARNVINHIMKKGLDVDAIFAHNDEMIIGAIQALQNLNKPLPVTVGFDAIPEAVAKVKKKELSATIAQNPYKMGFLTIKHAAQYLQGLSLEPFVFVDLLVIDR
jgi:ABC-type sugar transport system substrate-binding protein